MSFKISKFKSYNPGDLLYVTIKFAVKLTNSNYESVMLNVNDYLFILSKNCDWEGYIDYICYYQNKLITVTVFDYQTVHLR